LPSYKNADEFPHPPNLLTPKEAAEITGLSQGTLCEYARRRIIGSVLRVWRYGVYQRKAIYFPIEDLRLYMAKKAVKNTKRSFKTIYYRAPLDPY